MPLTKCCTWDYRPPWRNHQEKIKQKRTQAALNQEQFAQQLEISKYQLSKIEKNIEQVNIGIILNVCQILEIPFNFEIETKKLQTA